MITIVKRFGYLSKSLGFFSGGSSPSSGSPPTISFSRLSTLQLFYGEVISTVLFQFRNALRYLIKLLFEDRSLPFNGHRYFLELRMPDNDGIVIAGGNSAAELFAVLCFKVFLRCHRNHLEGFPCAHGVCKQRMPLLVLLKMTMFISFSSSCMALVRLGCEM